MAVQLITAIQNYQGLSSDTKPTDCPVGSKFYETDTGERFIYLGTSDGWIEDLSLIYALSQAFDG